MQAVSHFQRQLSRDTHAQSLKLVMCLILFPQSINQSYPYSKEHTMKTNTIKYKFLLKRNDEK